MKLFTKLINRFLYGNDYELIYNPQRKSQDRLTVEAVAGVIGLCFVRGSIQQSFLLKMGASDTLVSYLGTVTLVAGLAGLLGGTVFDRRKKRKGIIVTMLLCARLGLVSVMFIPRLLELLFGAAVSSAAAVPVMFTLITICTMVDLLADVGYNSMLAAVIPPNLRGRVMAVRSTVTSVLTPLFPVAGAWFLDSMNRSDSAYYILACVGALFLLTEAFLLMGVKEGEYPVPEKKEREKLHLFRNLKQQPEFMAFVRKSFFFYLFLYICGTYTNIYMISYVRLPLTIIEIGGMLCKLCMVLQYRRWGKLGDRIGAGRVVFISQVLFAVEMLSWVVIPPSWLGCGAVFLPFLLQACSNSSSGLSVFGRKYELAPEENQNLFIGIYGAAVAIACLIGPTIGNLFKFWLENHLSEAMLAGHWQIRFIYLAAGILLLVQKGVQLLRTRKAEI